VIAALQKIQRWASGLPQCNSPLQEKAPIREDTLSLAVPKV
jgi:hypothetical protein